MAEFFAELKRRQMFRVAAAYAVVAWVLLQFANNISPALRLPEWMPTVVVVLLVIGFPVALLFCWIQQLAPGGESSKTMTGKLDWVLIGALVIVIGLVSYQELAPINAAPAEKQPGVEVAKAAAASPSTGISLAVLPFAEAAAQQAIKLDPKSVDGYFALGQSRNDAGDRLSAIDLWRRALTLDPDYPDALQSYSILLTHMGFSKDAIPVRDHLLALEPLVAAFQGVTARILFADGQTDEAIAILKDRSSPLLAQIYGAQGRYREAADVLERIQAFDPDLVPRLATAVKLLRAAPAAVPENDRPELGVLNWVYLYAGAPELFLKTYGDKIRIGFAAGVENGLEWAPAYSSVRKSERFKAYVRDAGILTYWRERGWPDLCKPVGANDFACE